MTTHTITAFAKGPADSFNKVTYETEPLKPHEVYIKILSCGVCHTDLYFMQEGFIGGHEMAGVIQDAGSSVINLKIGDRVGFGYLRSSCLDCAQCVSGMEIMCPNKKLFTDGKGGYAHGAVWDYRFVYKIPDEIESKHASPLVCAGATVFGALYNSSVSPTARIGVIGIGGLGHLGLKFARAWGCYVVALSGTPSKKEEALSHGAHEFWNTKEITSETVNNYEKLDFIIDTVSGDLPWDIYINLLNTDGTFCLIGVPNSKMELTGWNFASRQVKLTGSLVASRGVSRKMLDFAARHNIRPQIEEFPMTEQGTADAIKRVADGSARYRAVLIAQDH